MSWPLLRREGWGLAGWSLPEACPIPPPAPQKVAARRKDAVLWLCTLLGGPPVALIGPRVPPRGDAAVPCPAGPPPSPPVTGAGMIADLPEGNTPARCCSPPPCTGRHRCPPPNTLGCPS